MADVEFTFSGNAASLKAALNDIKSEISRTKESVAHLTAQFGQMYIGVQGAIAAIRTAWTALSNIPGQAARIEDLTTVFKGLMGSAEEAGELLNGLWQDAAHGAVGLEEMAAAARPLTNVFSNTETIREWTRRFADISTGSGVAASQLSKVYARILTLGKVDSRAVESLAKQGLPIYQELSAVMGVTADKVQELAKKGEISAEQYTASLRRMTGEGGQFYQQSTQLSNTAQGSWNTLTETINRAAAALGTPINAAITPLLNDMTEALEKIMPNIEAFARSFVEGMQSFAKIIAPAVEGLGQLISALGGGKTVIASVAAALLIYSGSAQTAATSTTSLRAQVATLLASMRSLGSASIAQAFKTSMTSIRSVMTSTLAGMRVAWNAAWTTMAAVTRAAMIAVKTAIVSTGIGLIIVGIGEALGALYSWFMGNSEAAKQAAESARQFERALGQIEKQARKVRTQEQYDSFMEELEARIEELKEAREMAYQNEDWDKGEQLTEQLDKLWKKKAIYKETLPLQIEEARKAEEAARRMKEQAEAAAELEKKLEAAREKLDDMVKKQQEKSREDYLSGIEDTDKQITFRLQDAGGFNSLRELKAAMEELSRTTLMQESDVERYERMANAYNKIVELQKKAADKEKEKVKTAAEALAEYQREEAILAAQASGNTRLVSKLKEQQRIVQLTEQYRKAGMADAEERAKRIVELEKRSDTQKAQKDYTSEMTMLRAQIAGEEKKLALLKQQQRITQLTEEFRNQGLANAEAKAKKLVTLEQKAAAAASISPATRISDSMASVGGGGRSVVIGGPMLSESKKHTKLLQEVGVALKQKPTVQLSGTLKAVISR